MRDVDYEHNKINLVYQMTEHSIEQSPCMDMLLDRLKLIEQMHKESPGLNLQMQKLRIGATSVIPDMLLKEAKTIEETQTVIKNSVAEV